MDKSSKKRPFGKKIFNRSIRGKKIDLFVTTQKEGHHWPGRETWTTEPRHPARCLSHRGSVSPLEGALLMGV